MRLLAGWGRFGRAALAPEMVGRTARVAACRLWSVALSVGLRRDLGQAFVAPAAAFPLTIGPLVAGDVAGLLATDGGALTAEERWERATRRRLLDAGFGTCYVAVTGRGEACHMLWLFGAADNDRLARYFGGALPRLAPDQVLFEGLFTPRRFRGLGIMPAVVARIAELAAAERGARWALAFVRADNEASLRGCARAGFRPDTLRRETWRLLRRRTSFSPMATDDTLAAAVPLDGAGGPEPSPGRRRSRRDPPRTPTGRIEAFWRGRTMRYSVGALCSKVRACGSTIWLVLTYRPLVVMRFRPFITGDLLSGS